MNFILTRAIYNYLEMIFDLQYFFFFCYIIPFLFIISLGFSICEFSTRFSFFLLDLSIRIQKKKKEKGRKVSKHTRTRGLNSQIFAVSKNSNLAVFQTKAHWFLPFRLTLHGRAPRPTFRSRTASNRKSSVIPPLKVLGSANIVGGCSRNSRGFLANRVVAPRARQKLEPVHVIPLRDATSRPDLLSSLSSLVIWLMRQILDYIQARGYRNRVIHCDAIALLVRHRVSSPPRANSMERQGEKKQFAIPSLIPCEKKREDFRRNFDTCEIFFFFVRNIHSRWYPAT